ncbi:GUN4 domain-containing protein [Nostoc sp. NZL]|uniref:GUN4 domain-containing protein n=1 Tax=Nostoc sp. NZL TaxID=2650612 RepID=UPI0018C53828|nr:GUN4 domain-containing protein [Nostoc sp. NZL]MBG1244289.1 trypsin-like serine protease [Nostoc sp. NZL]
MTMLLESSIVRIFSNNSKVTGAGFLVSQRHILTCAHVVCDSLGINRTTIEKPDELITLDFPLVATKQYLKAKVVFWQPVNPYAEVEDIVGLELESNPPQKVQSAKLIKLDNLWGHSFRVFGFPAGQSNGVWASGVLRGRGANGWVQLEDLKQSGYKLEAGFSGAPIWDEELQGVVGMAVAAEMKRPETKVAFMIPMAVLNKVLSKLSEQETQNLELINTTNNQQEASEKSIAQLLNYHKFGLVDYSKLQELLAAGKWKEANQETEAVMLKVAGKGEKNILDRKDIDNFSCTVLYEIDQLWIRYSLNRFGFSVQRRIWQSQEVKQNFLRFGESVGWYKNNNWLSYEDINFVLVENSTFGYLPVVFYNKEEAAIKYEIQLNWVRFFNLFMVGIFSRLEVCGY